MTITKRDSRGRIMPGGKVLSSEDAIAQGKMQKGKKEKIASADQLLQDAGYPDPNDAPEVEKILADQAVSGNYSAAKSFRQGDQQVATIAAVQPGEKCPTCDQYVLADMQISDDEMESVIDGLDL